MTGAEILTRFTADTSQVDKATKNYGTGLGKLTTAFTLANVAAQAINKTIGYISQSMDGAIQRFDTMNNFPKVMKNLGIGADEADKSIKTLSDKLQGLPTSLDSAAMSVQRLTSKNGDVDKSTQLFLALNNAILAGGANSQIQASAIEQISQAYAKGKPDMMEWRTIMMAMPAQLKQVATAMGYVDADSLGQALRDGSVSMDTFMNTIQKLNTEGINGFDNFETQARNATGGVSTSITNMKTAMVRGVASMISEVDKGLGSFGGLSGVIGSIGKGAEELFKGLGQALGEVMPYLLEIGQSVMPVIKDVFETMAPTLKEFAKAVLPAITKLIQKVMPMISRMAQKVMPIINKILEAIIPLLDPLVDLIATIIDMQMALIEPLMDILGVILPPIIDILSGLIKTILPVLTGALTGLANLIRGAVSGAISFIKSIIEGFINFFVNIPTTIGNLINDIINFFKDLPYKIGNFIGEVIGHLVKFATQDVPNFISDTINWFKEMPGKIWNAVKQIPGKIWDALVNAKNKAIEGAQNIFNAVVDKLKKLPGEMLDIGKRLVEGLWDGIKSAGNWIGDKLKDFGNGIKDGLKKVFGIHSPSLVMKKEIGINLGLGVVEGIEDTQKEVNRALSGIGANINGSVGLNPSTIGNMNATTGGVNVIVNANFQQDPLGQMVSNIKTFSGGSKNDYNYGMGN